MNESFKNIWSAIHAHDYISALSLLEKINTQTVDDLKNRKSLLTFVLAQLGKYEEALEHALFLINQPDPMASDYNTLGNLYSQMNDTEKSEENYLKALQIDSNYINAWLNLANLSYKNNDSDMAKHYFEKSLNIDKSNIIASYHLSVLALKDNDIQTALTIVDPLFSKGIRHSKIINQWAQCHYLLENYEIIINELCDHLFDIPSQMHGAYYLASAYFKMKHYQKSLNLALEIKNNAPHYDQIHALIAHCYLNLNNKDQALKYYLLENERSKDADHYFNIAVILESKQRQREAIDYYKETLKLDSEYFSAYLNMGHLYLSQGSFDLAKDAYSQAYRITPDSNDLKFILSALDSENFIPEDTPPSSFIENLFDQYAPYYDKHLTQTLQFRVPQLLIKVLEKHGVIDVQKKISILDLGCGSGLLGELLSPFASIMVGIDLSKSMLEIAKVKNCYQKLIHSDYLDFKDNELFDLITASDFVPYLGNVSLLFDYCKANLKPQGFLVLSYETSDQDSHQDYFLDKTLRYKHASLFIQKLLNEHNFKIIHREKAVLRHNHKKPIDGEIVLAQLR
jgi:predicted TPR repeat methyltransferase